MDLLAELVYSSTSTEWRESIQHQYWPNYYNHAKRMSHCRSSSEPNDLIGFSGLNTFHRNVNEFVSHEYGLDPNSGIAAANEFLLLPSNATWGIDVPVIRAAEYLVVNEEPVRIFVLSRIVTIDDGGGTRVAEVEGEPLTCSIGERLWKYMQEHICVNSTCSVQSLEQIVR